MEEPDDRQALMQRLEWHAYNRLIGLSDGVFAIAITIAAFEIHPPANWDQNPATLLHLLGPALSAYTIAFIVIAAFWMAHRQMITRLVRVDGVVTVLNLVFLGLVALQPAAIRLLTDYKVDGGAGVVYFEQIVLLGAVQAALWVYAWLKGGIIDPAIPRNARFLILGSIVVTPLLSAWVGMSIGHTSHLRVTLVIIGLVAASFARRFINRRIGL